MNLSSLPQPVIFAHRGASAHAPENTLAAFELALHQQADALELDVKLTSDGQVIVMHDANLERTTGARGLVKDFSLAEVRSLSAGHWFDAAFENEKVPLLEEVLEAFGKRILINIELTNYNTPRDALVETVCVLVQRLGVQDHIIFSSFIPGNLAKAKHLLPEVPRALLALNGLLGAWSRSFGFAFGQYEALHPYLSNTTQQQIQRVHRLGRRIHVWTVNAVEDMRLLFKWGVDGIFTDDPQLAVQTREAVQ